jgi:hypothetical protein
MEAGRAGRGVTATATEAECVALTCCDCVCDAAAGRRRWPLLGGEAAGTTVAAREGRLAGSSGAVPSKCSMAPVVMNSDTRLHFGRVKHFFSFSDSVSSGQSSAMAAAAAKAAAAAAEAHAKMIEEYRTWSFARVLTPCQSSDADAVRRGVDAVHAPARLVLTCKNLTFSHPRA